MARSDWTRAKIGQFATPIRRPVVVEPDKQYRTMGVKWWGLGAYERETKPGHEIKAPKMFAVKPGDLIINKIWVRHGSSGIVGDELDGCFVTTDFPTFEIDTSRVERRWLAYLFRTETFWKDCEAKSRGTSGRQRIDPKEYLEIEIPLPPLAEQQRIVARIDALAARIAEAQKLQAEATEEAEGLRDSNSAEIFEDLTKRFPLTRIADADLEMNRESRNPAKASSREFAYVDISSVGQGPTILNTAKIIPARNAPSRARRVIHKDDVILSTVRPNLRTIALIGESLDNQICSTGFVVFSCGESINSNFLMHQMCSSFFIDQCVAFATGGHYPAINDTSLREVRIVVPPLDEQRRIVAYLDRLQARVDALKQLQAQTQKELDAFLPSVLDKAFRGEL